MTKLIPRHFSSPNHGCQDEVLPPSDPPRTQRLHPLSEARGPAEHKCARRPRGSGLLCSRGALRPSAWAREYSSFSGFGFTSLPMEGLGELCGFRRP